MNYKKLLLAMIVIFCLVIKLDAMDGAIAVRGQKPTFKSLAGIPLLNLEKVYKNRDSWSEEKKQKIRQQLSESSSGKVLALFNIATLLPRELQEKIALEVCDGKVDEVENFFGKPIVDVFNRYDWASQVFRGDIFPEIKNMCQASLNWNPDAISEHSREIPVFDAWRNDREQSQDRKALESVSKVYEKFLSERTGNFHHYDIHYACREFWTLRNFKERCNRWQWILLPVVLFPFAVKALAQYNYPELSLQEMEKITSQYQKQEILNATVRDKLQETQDDEWLDLLSTKIQSPDEYKQASIDGKSDIVVWSYIVPGALIGLVGGGMPAILIVESLTEKKWGMASTVCVSMGVYVPIIFIMTFGAGFLGFFLDSIIERPAFGAACATGCYAALVSLYNVIQMRSIKKNTVQLRRLSELLQRSDIEII